MKRRSHISAVLGVLIVFAQGCGPEEPSPSMVRSELRGNFGEVRFVYSQPTSERADDGGVATPPFEISARFVRVRDLGRGEARLLWGAELPPADVPLGECQQLDPAQPYQDTVLSSSVELLDAGELSLRLGEQELGLPTQSFPSVYGVVSGVLYGGETLAVPFQPEQQYRIASRGSAAIGAFEVDVAAPEEFESLFVAGAEVGVEPVTLETAGQALEVRWEPGRASNEILVELSYSQFGVEQRVACRSQEDGVVEVPAHLASRLLEAGVSDARVVISRVARAHFAADGLDEGEAVFVVAAATPIEIP
jgi:hypothetical protein